MTRGRVCSQVSPCAAKQAKGVRSRPQAARHLVQQRQRSHLDRRCTDGSANHAICTAERCSHTLSKRALAHAARGCLAARKAARLQAFEETFVHTKQGHLGSLAMSILYQMLRHRTHLMLGGGCAQPRHVVLTKAVTQQLQHARCWLCTCLLGLCGNAQGPVGRFGPRRATSQIPLRVLQSNNAQVSITSCHLRVQAGNMQGVVKQFGSAGAANAAEQNCSRVVHHHSSAHFGNVQDLVMHSGPRVAATCCMYLRTGRKWWLIEQATKCRRCAA